MIVSSFYLSTNLESLRLVSQLFQMSLHLQGGNRQRFGAVGVYLGGDGGGGGITLGQQGEHLLFALEAVIQILLQQGGRVFDHRAVAGQNGLGREGQHRPQRVQVSGHVAIGGDNQHRSFPGDQIAGEQEARFGPPEAEMIGGMAGGVEDG